MPSFAGPLAAVLKRSVYGYRGHTRVVGRHVRLKFRGRRRGRRRRRRGPKREQKYVTINVTSNNDTPTATLLTEINQGTTNITRIGRTIYPKSIQMKGTIAINASATSTRVRVVVVRDRMNTGTAPTFSNIFNSATALVSLRNHQPQFMSRFTILYDNLIALDVNNDDQVVMNWYKYLKGRIIFQGVNGTDEGIGSIWVFTYGSEVTNDPIIDLKFRIRFTDQ